MRRFSLTNIDTGASIDLNGTIGWMTAPQGWGFENKVEYMEAEGFFIETSRQHEQVEKSGTMVFLPPNAYEDYRTFADFVAKAEHLRLGYKPQTEWFYVDVDIKSIEKAELTTWSALEVPVTFLPTSPIYSELVLEYVVSGDVQSNLKKYDYPYPYSYSASAIGGQITFTTAGQLPSYMTVSMNGAISAPKIIATVDDTVIGKADLSTLSVASDEQLVYDSRPTSAGITVDGEDVTSYAELSSIPTFFSLPVDKEITLEIDATSLSGLTAYVKVYKYYRSV